MNPSPSTTSPISTLTEGARDPGADRRRARWALLLFVPVPTVGAWVGLHLDPGPVGRAVWLGCKGWVVAFPLVWWFGVERKRWSWSPPTRGGWGLGLVTGLAFAAAILIGPSWVPPEALDPEALRTLAEQSGFATPAAFIGLALALSFGNALVEEVVWRWFVFVKAEAALGRAVGRVGAVLASGLFFTLHHIVVLAAYFPPTVVLLGSVGVFIGGCTWSALYLRYRSIWPGYLSHILADLAIFVVGWKLLFG